MINFYVIGKVPKINIYKVLSLRYQFPWQWFLDLQVYEIIVIRRKSSTFLSHNITSLKVVPQHGIQKL